MIQLSNLLSTISETPVKAGATGIADGVFADLLAGEMEAELAMGGKLLPGALPAGGKTLPLASLPIELPTLEPVNVHAAAPREGAVAEVPATGPIVIPRLALAAAANASLGSTPTEEAEAKPETPRPEAHAPVAAKTVALELKSRTRSDRTDARATAEHLADPETADAEIDGPVARPTISAEAPIVTERPLTSETPLTSEAPIATEVPVGQNGRDLNWRAVAVEAHVTGPELSIDTPAGRPAIAPEEPVARRDVAAQESDSSPEDVATTMRFEVPELLAATAAGIAHQAEPDVAIAPAPEEQLTSANRADAVRPETKRAEAGAPNAQQNPLSGQAGGQGEEAAARDRAGQEANSDRSAQRDGARNQRGNPELRFELSRASGEARIERSAGTPAQTLQIRTPMAAVAQTALPDHAINSQGQVVDIAAAPVATNTASTSFASEQGLRPHEFSTLVDRLVEARETARGGSIDVAVMHAEFGEVSLRFRQDASGLSVSMANSDPEFARAVSEATQADGAQTGDNGGQGARRDEGSSNGDLFARSGNSRDWGQSTADANMNGGGRQNTHYGPGGEQMTAQSRNPAGEDQAAQDGIYA